jgi:hypothetical protein
MTEAHHREQRDERAEVAIGVKCGTEAGRRAFVAMIDLTVAGCCLFAREARFVVGQKIILHPECLAPVKGTIQWSRGPLTGVKFDSALYPAVFEHLARTHPWRLPESAKRVFDSNTDIPAAVQRELSTMIDRAEDVFHKRDAPKDVFVARPLITGSRPGLARQQPDRKLVNLFLS